MFQFLSNVPFVEEGDIPTPNDECYVCKEPFETTPFQLERPVRLDCGHIIGLKCLARWVLSKHFDSECSLCRVKVVNSSRLPAVNRSVDYALIVLETIAVFEGPVSPVEKERLLENFQRVEGRETLDKNRRTMLYEEVVENLFEEEVNMPHDTVVLPPMAPMAEIPNIGIPRRRTRDSAVTIYEIVLSLTIMATTNMTIFFIIWARSSIAHENGGTYGSLFTPPACMLVFAILGMFLIIVLPTKRSWIQTLLMGLSFLLPFADYLAMKEIADRMMVQR